MHWTFTFSATKVRKNVIDLWIEFFEHLVMGQNEHSSVFTNISEDEGHGNLSISNLSPDLGPDFNNQVCTANLFVFDKYLSPQTMWQQHVKLKCFSFGLWSSLWFFWCPLWATLWFCRKYAAVLQTHYQGGNNWVYFSQIAIAKFSSDQTSCFSTWPWLTYSAHFSASQVKADEAFINRQVSWD